MGRSGRDRSRSRSPRRSRRANHNARSPRRRSLSADRAYKRPRSPRYAKRASPVYEREEWSNARNRGPSWIDADISEGDVREQAGGDPVEFRRLKRLKLNDRGVRSFWQNSPTPSPSPERHRSSRQVVEETELWNGNGNSEVAARLATEADGVSLRPSELLQREILAESKDATSLHLKAADLFKLWLADEKAAAAEAELRRKQQEADSVIIGPVLEATEKAAVDYGTHMRPGEGTAMAAYVQSGKRIPRRGEVGMSADQISSFEDLGYVMSGSRHNRMNAIRIRKENQVYTAEEKAALAMFNMEENKRKEQKILGDMQRLVQKTLGETEEDAAPQEEETEPAQ